MKGFSPRHGKRRLRLLLPLIALLTLLVYLLQGCPTLTAEGTLRRLERTYLFGPTQVVARGDFALTNVKNANASGNTWLVSSDGKDYGVAVLERFWGFFYRPQAPDLSFWVSGRRGDAPLEYFRLSGGTAGPWSETITDSGSHYVHAFEEAFLVLSRDATITRVEVVEAFLPTLEESQREDYLALHGVGSDCRLVAPGIWQGQVKMPMEDGSGPWVLLRGYNAAGTLVYQGLN